MHGGHGQGVVPGGEERLRELPRAARWEPQSPQGEAHPLASWVFVPTVGKGGMPGDAGLCE